MKRKIIIRLLLLVAVSVFLYSCVHDDPASASDIASSSTEYTNKSLWKEDETYIKNVIKVYEQYADKNYFTSNFGTISWDHALTMGGFDESYLEVPVIKNGKVSFVLVVEREGNRVHFRRKEEKRSNDFFDILVFKNRNQLTGTILGESSNTQSKGCITTEITWTWTNSDGSAGPSYTFTETKCQGPVLPCQAMEIGANCGGSTGGGGGGGGIGSGGNADGGYPYDPNPNQDPCVKTKTSIRNANNVLKNNDIKQKMDAILKGKTQAANEWAVAIGQKPNGYEVTSAVEQNSTSGTVPNSLLTTPYIGDGHSHGGGFGNPSAGDLYGMLNSILTNPGLKYRYVYGDYFGTPEVYVLVVDDSNLSSIFLTNYPKNENYNPSTHSFLNGSSVGNDFFTISNLYGQGTFMSEMGDIRGSAAGLAYVLDKYNAGISLAKVDNNGNLKRVNVKKENIVVPGGNGSPKEGLNISNCP